MTIADDNNVEKVVVDHVKRSSPKLIVDASATIVKIECQQQCKRGSGTVLQAKDHDDFFTFSWDRMYKELEARCPGLVTILSAVVGDKKLSESQKRHLAVMSAVGFHGRSQEMSLVQYMIGFVLTHGGCTQRVTKIMNP